MASLREFESLVNFLPKGWMSVALQLLKAPPREGKWVGNRWEIGLEIFVTVALCFRPSDTSELVSNSLADPKVRAICIEALVSLAWDNKYQFWYGVNLPSEAFDGFIGLLDMLPQLTEEQLIDLVDAVNIAPEPAHTTWKTRLEELIGDRYAAILARGSNPKK
jgi:hypothetical protein